MMMKKVTLETIVYFLAMAFSFKNAIKHIETFFFEGLLDFAFAVMFGYFLYMHSLLVIFYLFVFFQIGFYNLLRYLLSTFLMVCFLLFLFYRKEKRRIDL